MQCSMTDRRKTRVVQSLRLSRRKELITAAILMALGSAIAPLIDATGKMLTATLGVLQIVWIRYAVHSASMATLSLLQGNRPGKLIPSWIQVIRGTCQYASSLFLLASLKTLALPSALVIAFLAPLFVVCMRGFLRLPGGDLGSILIAGIGFLGVFLTYAPALTQYDVLGSLYALAAAILFSLYLLLTGFVAASTSSIVNSFHTSLPGCLLGLPFMVGAIGALPSFDAFILVSIGLLSALSHLLISAAMKTEFSSAIAPICYVELPAGMLYGLLLFSHEPNAFEVIGSAIVSAAGIGILFRLNRVPS